MQAIVSLVSRQDSLEPWSPFKDAFPATWSHVTVTADQLKTQEHPVDQHYLVYQ